MSQRHRRVLYEVNVKRITIRSYRWQRGCFGMLRELDDRQRDPKRKSFGTYWELQAKKASK